MWQYQNNALDMDQLLVNESLFTLANGYLGIRGCFEEDYDQFGKSIRGTYINGVYDTLPVSHPEKLYGFPEFQDKQPNLVDLQTAVIQLDGERVGLFSGSHNDYKRSIYLDRGYSERSFSYRTKSGKTAHIRLRRLVSFEIKELFLQEINVDYDGEIQILSTMDTDVTNYTNPDDPRVGSEHARLLKINGAMSEGSSMYSEFETVHSGIRMACGSRHMYASSLADGSVGKILIADASDAARGKYGFEFAAKGNINLTKYNVYSDSIRYDKPEEHVQGILDQVEGKSFECFAKQQREHLDTFWKASDIVIKGSDEDQLSIRFNLYQLYQSVGRDMHSNISAKGLSGEGYEGHYFWDTEIYVLPTFQLSQNEIARNLLLYRYNQLDAARERARVLGHKRGVKFPWRTISGIECSAYYPAGTAQYHINGDVAHSFIQHYIFSGDLAFMEAYGAEVLFETAVLWLEMGHFHDGLFKIDAVTGPDEYSCIVNNNYYTNALAKHNLEWAVKVYDLFESDSPVKLKALMLRIGVDQSDIDLMRKAAECMYLPHDETLGIDMQDDGFLNKKVWDFENTPEDHYPLLLHYHPLTIYRYQVLKQPDTVLAHFLLEGYTDLQTMKNSYDYYEKITTHDSSLSQCVYGIMASRVGYRDKAYEYFGDSLKLDLENTHGNTKDGLHMANLAGTALSIIYGFAGLRVTEKGISLRPWLPDGWEAFAFKVKFRGRLLSIRINDALTVELLEGEPLAITLNDKVHNLETKIFLPLNG